MKHTKIIAAVVTIATVLCFAAACSKDDSANWQEEAKKTLPAKFDETNLGQFYLDGTVYSFPCKVSELLDKGWTFEDATIADTKLEAYGWYKQYINLRDPNNKELEVAICNDTAEEALVKDSKVGEIALNNFQDKGMVSGGVAISTPFSTPEGILENAVEGFEFDEKQEATPTDVHLIKSFKGAGDYTCTADFFFSKPGEELILSSVRYRCDFSFSHAAAINAILEGAMKNDPQIVNDLDPRLDGDTFIPDIRRIVAKDFIFTSGFNVEATEEQYEKVYKIMDGIYGKESFKIESKGEQSVITYSAPSNFSEVFNSSIEEVAQTFDGDLEKATSDPKFFDLTLDAFLGKLGDLKIEPGKSYVIDNEKFAEGAYDVLYGMLGFYSFLNK